MKPLLCFLLASISLHIHAQNPVDSLRYVDFHIHTSMKNYYRDIPHPDSMNIPSFAQRFTRANWSGTRHQQYFKNKKDFSGFWGKTSYPQASFDLLRAGNASILCTSITPLEKLTVSDRRVRMSFFGLFGIRMPIRNVNHKMVTMLHMDRLKTIDDPNNTAFNEFMGEYKYLLNQELSSPNGTVRLVKDKNDLLQARSEGTTALVLSLEGGHILYGPYNTANYNNYQCDDNCYTEIGESGQIAPLFSLQTGPCCSLVIDPLLSGQTDPLGVVV